jgi:hypothetical protein
MDEVTFWATGERDGDCLLWPLSGNQGGYGHVWLRGRLRQTHRLAWELTHGPIPPGLCVLHRCDVRRCYNPDHLWVGTKDDNNKDRSAKGRSARLSGGSNPNASLTAAQAEEIRARYTPRYAYESGRWRSNAPELTGEYKISRAALYRLLRGATYAHRP